MEIKSTHIRSMLCLSTAHVKPETMKRLQQGDFDWLVSYAKVDPKNAEKVWGAFILLDDIDLREGSEETKDVPEDLMRVLLYADAFHANWIMFDVDEDILGDLPMYSDAWA